MNGTSIKELKEMMSATEKGMHPQFCTVIAVVDILCKK